MRIQIATCWAVALLIAEVSCSVVKITGDENTRRQCSGMYSRKAWAGDVDPFVSISLNPQTGKDDGKDDGKNGTGPSQIASAVIFEFRDEDLIGRIAPGDPNQRLLVCDDAAVNGNLCTAEQLGQFLLGETANSTSHNPILTQAIELQDPSIFRYAVNRTGYYCAYVIGMTATDFTGSIEFRNAYGQLEGSQIPKLPFYGGLTIVYGVLAAFWGFLYVQNRHDILSVQNYISAIIIFLIFEQFVTWGFYEYSNTHGSNLFAKVLTIIVAILNAGRNSFSFFLLLIVCMGYGVVRDDLGRTMLYVRILTGCHFFFGVIYVIASLQVTPDNAGPIVLLVVLPLAATLTTFYVWTLNSLGMTRKDLLERKQTVKAAMYNKLWYCILGSILVTFAFFFFGSFNLAERKSPNYVPNHWKSRWFVLDGWLNLVYLFDISFIAYLWRPTANNRRFAMSDEIAQDDEGFEIASFGGSLDDEESARSIKLSPRDGHGELSPMPPTPIDDSPVEQRRSGEGETIFAVAEDGDGDGVGEDDDKWSDDEADAANSGKGKYATGKKS